MAERQMAHVDWELKGIEIVTCNCNWGCPCMFNAPPTHGNCRAAIAMQFDEGHFGDVKLNGLRWVGLYAWPGAIHEGRGEMLAILDERTDDRQRDAIRRITAGEETEPVANIFSFFASTIDKVHPPLVRKIHFEADMKTRLGRFSVQDVVEAQAEPICEPGTRTPYYAQVSFPSDIHYLRAEFVSSTTRAKSPISLDWANRHGNLGVVHWTTQGPVR
jgi:hypothetical protein